MHPGSHVPVPVIAIGEPRHIFTEVSYCILGIIVYDALQESFQALGANQELVLIISMCDCLVLEKVDRV